MAHPSCALARPLHPPPAGGNAFGDCVLPSAQADTEAKAVHEALRATICLRKLVALARGDGSAACEVRGPELLLLIAIVEAEFNRRMRAVMATLTRMQPI